MQCLHVIYSYKTKHKKQSQFIIIVWTLHLSKVSVTRVMHGGVYDSMTGVTRLNGARGAEGSERGELWDNNTLTEFREEEWDSNKGRQTGREEEEEGRDVVHTAQLSLAQVDIRPPFLPSAALLSCSSWCSEGGGWMVVRRWRNGWRGDGWGRAGRTDGERERERGREDEGGLLGH